MPEYACEPGAYLDWQNVPATEAVFNPPSKYVAGTYNCFERAELTPSHPVGRAWDNNGYLVCCGFLAETAETEEKPVSFYLAVVSLVYCAVLTVVFAVWASKHRPNTAVSRRVASQVRYATQVVVQQPQQPQVVIQPTA